MSSTDADKALRSEVSRISLVLSDYRELLVRLQQPNIIGCIPSDGQICAGTSLTSQTSLTGLTEDMVRERAAMTIEEVKAQLKNRVNNGGTCRNYGNRSGISDDDVDISSTYELCLDGMGLTDLGTEVGINSTKPSSSSVKPSNICSPLVLFTSLRKLTFNFNHITAGALTPNILRAIFSSLSELKDLQLDYNKIEKGDAFLMGLSGTKAAQKLESLSMVQNSIKTVSPLTKVSFPKLGSLDLSHNQLTIFTSANFNVPNLTYLDLSFNSLTSLKPSFIGSLINLTFLNVSGNELTSLDGIGSLTVLEELHASRNKLQYIPALANNNPLKTVGLKAMRGREDSSSNAVSLGRTGLQVIDVSDNNIGSLIFFPTSGSMAHVWSLNISKNDFTSSGDEISPATSFLEQLAALFPMIEVLDIGGNGSTIVPSYQDLRHLTKLTEISELNIVGTLGPSTSVVGDINDNMFHEIPGIRVGMSIKEKHRKAVEAFLPNISVLDKEMIKAPPPLSSVGPCQELMDDCLLEDSIVSSRPGSTASIIRMRPQSSLGNTLSNSNSKIGSLDNNSLGAISYRPTSAKGVVRDGAGDSERLNAIRAVKAAAELDETRLALEAMIQKANVGRLKCQALCEHMGNTMKWALENGIGSAPEEPNLDDIENGHNKKDDSTCRPSTTLNMIKNRDQTIPLSARTPVPEGDTSSEEEAEVNMLTPSPPNRREKITPTASPTHLRTVNSKLTTSLAGRPAGIREHVKEGLAPLFISKGPASSSLSNRNSTGISTLIPPRNAPASAGTALNTTSRGIVRSGSAMSAEMKKRSNSQSNDGIFRGNIRVRAKEQRLDPSEFKEAMNMAEEKLRKERLGLTNKNSLFSKYNNKGHKIINNTKSREMATSTNSPRVDDMLRRSQGNLKGLSDSLCMELGICDEHIAKQCLDTDTNVRCNVAIETSPIQGNIYVSNRSDIYNTKVMQHCGAPDPCGNDISLSVNQYKLLTGEDDNDNEHGEGKQTHMLCKEEDTVKVTCPADPMGNVSNTGGDITMEGDSASVSRCIYSSNRLQTSSESLNRQKLEILDCSLSNNKSSTGEENDFIPTGDKPEKATYFDTKIAPSKKIVKTLTGGSLNIRQRKR